jgi:outer membrane protein
MKKLLPLVISVAFASVSHYAMADNLSQVYQQAKQNDPQLLAAAAQKNQAFSAIGEANSALLPQINLTGGYNVGMNVKEAPENGNERTFHGFTTGVQLEQSIYNKAIDANLSIAQLRARASDAQYAATQQGVMLKVAQAYFNVLQSQDDLKFVQAEKKAVGRQLEQTKQRYDVGLAAMTDVQEARAKYDAVLARVIQQQNVVTNSYEGLNEITGQNYSNIDALNTQSFRAEKPEHSISHLLQRAEKDNLTLLAERINQDIARQGITAAEAGRSPTVGVGAGYNYNELSPANKASDGQLTAGVTVTIPLYTGGRINSQVKQAQYGYVAASENLEQAHRSVIRNIRADYNNINASISSIRAYEQSLVSASSALKATDAGYEVGTRTIVDVLNATQSVYNANTQLAQARYTYLLSDLQLKQAVGTLNEGDLHNISRMLK